MVHSVVSADGTPIAYDRTGAGSPVVIVGGAFNTRPSVAAWARPLAERHSVYAHDRRGRGDSGDTPPYDVAREIDDLAAVIEAAGGHAALFGHSSGGALVLAAAAAGLPVTRVAVYEPPYSVADDSDPTPGLAADLRELASTGPAGSAATRFLTDVGTPPGVVEQIRHSPDWPGMVSVEHTLWYDMTLLGDGGVPIPMLGRITVPVLVLAGGAGWDWVRASGAVVADSVPDGVYRELEGEGHGVSPEALAPALLEFFGGP